MATQAVKHFATACGPRGHLASKLPTQVLSLRSVSHPSAAISISRVIVPSSLRKDRNFSNSDASEPKETKFQAEITKKVYFDIEIGGQRVEPNCRIVIGLYGHDAPETVKSFLALCTGTTGENQFRYTYKGSRFHGVFEGFWIMGGYFEKKDAYVHDKEGKKSIYEWVNFKDEKSKLVHNGPGVVSMDKKGEYPNTRRFFISTFKNDSFDRDKIVFGHVLHGMDVVKKIESLQDGYYRPRKNVVISACGEWPSSLDASPLH